MFHVIMLIYLCVYFIDLFLSCRFVSHYIRLNGSLSNAIMTLISGYVALYGILYILTHKSQNHLNRGHEEYTATNQRVSCTYIHGTSMIAAL